MNWPTQILLGTLLSFLAFVVVWDLTMGHPEIMIVSGEAIILYKDFHYRVRGGETFLGICTDSSLKGRIRTADGSIRLERPLERQLDSNQ